MGPDRWRFVSRLFTPGWLTNVFAAAVEADAAQVSGGERRPSHFWMTDLPGPALHPPHHPSVLQSRFREEEEEEEKAHLFNNPPPARLASFIFVFLFSSETLAMQRVQNANWNCSALKKHRGFFIHASMLCGESYCRMGDRQTASSMGRCSQR